MAVPSPTLKAELRDKALKARRDYARTLDAGTRDSLETSLADRILPHLLTARIVAAYHPLRDEISPLILLDKLSAGQTIAMPWFAGRDSRMLFREGPATVPGPWGLPQPDAEAAMLSPDIVIVPLVLADRRGARIGRGQGHYDRALAHLRDSGTIFTIGIAWMPQIADALLPTDAWDVPLDAIATPAEWIDCRHMRETNR